MSCFDSLDLASAAQAHELLIKRSRHLKIFFLNDASNSSKRLKTSKTICWIIAIIFNVFDNALVADTGAVVHDVLSQLIYVHGGVENVKCWIAALNGELEGGAKQTGVGHWRDKKLPPPSCTAMWGWPPDNHFSRPVANFTPVKKKCLKIHLTTAGNLPPPFNWSYLRDINRDLFYSYALCVRLSGHETRDHNVLLW